VRIDIAIELLFRHTFLYEHLQGALCSRHDKPKFVVVTGDD